MLSIPIRVSVIAGLILVAFLASPTISKPKNLRASEDKSVNHIVSKTKPNKLVITITAKKDNRQERLEKFLLSKGSPLASEAKNFIEVADKYDLDWRLLPAISGIESQFGLMIPGNSYNPYGWNNGNFSFGNWNNANNYVAENIKIRWGVYGKITPWKIGRYYASSPTWAVRVSTLMNQIGQYE